MTTYADITGVAARILIVDDDRGSRRLIKLFLAPEEYVLLTADSGEAALAVVEEYRPDLILLDVMMPGMDGYQLVAKLKESAATRNIPVVMLTALDDRNARMSALNAGAEDFLSKPVDRAELCVRVRNLLRLKAYADAHDRHGQMLEREVAERTSDVRREADRAQRYLDTAQVVLLALDMQGNITLVNRYACSMLGWSADELIGRNWVDTCITPRMRAHVRSRLARLHAGEVSVSENVVVTRSHAERLVEWRSAVVRDETGSVIGTLSSGTDITARNNAVAALQTAEERMRFALTNAHIGTWDMDYTAGVIQWSEILEVQHGLEPGSFTGTVAALLARVHVDDRHSVREAMHAAAQSGEDFTLEYRAIGVDGTDRWLCGTGRFRRAEDGSTRGVGISQDVTSRRTLERQYRQAQKMEAFGQLSAAVAHDFNNLLAVILGFAELISRDTAESGTHAGDLAEIIKAATRATALTRHLLAFSRQQVFHSAPLDINALIVDMQGMLRMLTGDGISIVHSLAPNVSLTVADRGQIEQVLMNLVVNARDAMPDGGTLTIETSDIDRETTSLNGETMENGAYLMIAVRDTGAGMSKETQRRLFEPFFTTKEVGKGTGLGLSTAYGIVKQSKGHISVDSEPGRGTTFKVYLPSSRSGVVARIPAGAVGVPSLKDVHMTGR